MEVSERINQFLTEKQNMGWTDTSLKRARKRLAVFEADMSEVSEYSETQVEAWEKLLKERGLSARTRTEYLTLARQFLASQGYISAKKKRGAPLELTGKQFGELIAIEPCEGKRSKERSILWKCRCSCGNVVEISANELNKGQHSSCGCKRIERLQAANQYVDGTSLKMVFSDTIRRDNTSGCKGVYWKNDRWAVRIQYKGKRYFLGTFEKFEEAVKVRKEAEEKIRDDAAEQIFKV